MRKLSLLTLFIFIVLHSKGQDSLYQKIDRLIKTGEPERALTQLKEKDYNRNPKLIYLEGMACLHVGKNDLAEEKLNNALSLFEKRDDQKWIAQCLGELGNIYWTKSQNYQALQYHFNALNLRENLNDKSDIAASYNDIGLVYSMIDPSMARDYYEKAYQIYLETYGPGNERVTNSIINMALIHSKLDNYQQALNSIDRALEIKKGIHPANHPDLGFIHAARGEIHSKAGKLNQALESYRMSMIIYRTNYGDKHPELANIHNRIASIYLIRGNFTEALRSCQEAMKANHPSFESDDFLQIPGDDDFYNPDIFLVSLILKGQAFESRYFTRSLKRKDLLSSLSLYETGDQLIDQLRHVRTNQEDKLFLNGQANELYENAISISLELANISIRKKPFREKAFYFSEKSKAIILLDAINDANAKEFAGLPEEMIDHENDLKSKIDYTSRQLVDKPGREKEKELRNELLNLTQEYDQFIDLLEKEYPEYYSLKYDIRIPSVTELQRILPDNQAIQSYFIAENRERLYVFQISNKRFRTINVPLEINLNRFLIGFRNSIVYDLPEEFMKIGSELYDQLIPKRFFNGITEVTIIPSGRLGVTPFEALVKKYDPGYNYDEADYLIHQTDITYQFSASLLFQNLKSKRNNVNKAILMAPVEFNYNKSSNLASLPGTIEEINEIDNLLNKKQYDTRAFLYADASESMIKSDTTDGNSYIHIASHGVVNERHPELSCIYLAGGSPGEDGNLYTGEIYNLSLNADLVTLSACQTGMGRIHKGEGIVGLSRALLFAGAKNMLVSLWKVDDESTSKLMSDFYKNSIVQDNRYSNALGNVKRELINSSLYCAPYHWASFILIGR